MNSSTHSSASGASVGAPLSRWLAELGARSGVPGGGAASAVILGVAAALMHMAAAYSPDDDDIRALERRLTERVRACEDLSERDGRISGALGAALAQVPGSERDANVVAAAREGMQSSTAIIEMGVRLAGDLLALRPRVSTAVLADVGVAALTLSAGIEAGVINLRADRQLLVRHLVSSDAEPGEDDDLTGTARAAASHAASVAAEISRHLAR